MGMRLRPAHFVHGSQQFRRGRDTHVESVSMPSAPTRLASVYEYGVERSTVVYCVLSICL